MPRPITSHILHTSFLSTITQGPIMLDAIQAIFTTQGLIALLTLTAMEVVLGIDNLVFIAILSGRLPEHQRKRAARLGIAAAVATRLMLVCLATLLLQADKQGVTLFGHFFSIKDGVLIAGGLFLLWKATHELHHKVKHGLHTPTADVVPEDAAPTPAGRKRVSAFSKVILQIMMIDIVFSIDSVITAVGMVPDNIGVIFAAVILSAVIMVAAAGPVMNFVQKNPTIKILALAFLLLIGGMIVAEGFGEHVSKGYIYFAMAFSLAVEMLQMFAERNTAAAGAAPARTDSV